MPPQLASAAPGLPLRPCPALLGGLAVGSALSRSQRHALDHGLGRSDSRPARCKTDVRACVPACLPACLRASMLACLRSCVPACLPASLRACARSLAQG
eukprot:13322793-Alexandrium_andersonii.AAC.1